jgi:hypothetical protein
MSEKLSEANKPTQGEPESASAVSQTPPSPALAELLCTVDDPALTEDFALSLLKRPDLPIQVIERLAKNGSVLKSRKVKIALVSHPHTPRHVSVPMSRRFYTFDLMKVALSPSVPADVKVAIDDVLISRLNTVTLGERLTLARRASGRVAGVLLLDVKRAGFIVTEEQTAGASRSAVPRKDGEQNNLEAFERETRVMRTALDNPRLTESLVINSVLRANASPALVEAVARHGKWSVRKEIQIALLRTEHLSLARALKFSHEIPSSLLQEALGNSRLPSKIKEQLLRERKADDMTTAADVAPSI